LTTGGRQQAAGSPTSQRAGSKPVLRTLLQFVRSIAARREFFITEPTGYLLNEVGDPPPIEDEGRSSSREVRRSPRRP